MTRFTLLIAALLLSVPGSGQVNDDAKTYLNQGVQAYKNHGFSEAVGFFQKAADLDPNSKTAHLYLATAYQSQYIPRAESPDNVRLAENALREFKTVLSLDPNDENAAASLARLYFDQDKLDEARDWNTRVIAINPKRKEAYYLLGVIAWRQWLVPDREARKALSMRPEDPGPLTLQSLREELKAKYLPMLDEGIVNMAKALDLDKEYDDAMAYMNLLIRYRADLLDTPAAYKEQVEVANDWVQKTLATKKKKAERP